MVRLTQLCSLLSLQKTTLPPQLRYVHIDPYCHLHHDNKATTTNRQHDDQQVKMRQPYAQWRYKLDVIVDGRYIYFDRFVTISFKFVYLDI